ncbi:hypothetical protein C8P70_11369 [Myroides indicus]|uniref:PH (Pleckstrin Homology) domain-containing protein n=2 Tax=Myroides indicus TaxID=1323422 RepID=A0A4R7EW83_9FLAO|nr:hypothetical protein C8P70_11369 [Myroides indicus]
MLNLLFEKNTKIIIIISSIIITLCLLAMRYYFLNSNKYIVLLPFGIILNVIIMLIEKGIQINKTTNEFRIYKSLFGLKYGKWKPLPNISYISVFKAQRVQKTNRGKAMNYRYFNVYEINLFDHNNHCTTLFETDIDLFKETKSAAVQINQYLNIPLLDATTVPYKWI